MSEALLAKVRGLRQFEEVSTELTDAAVHIDGDYLAYWAACKDGTPVGVAREVAYNKIEKIRLDSRCKRAVVHLTSDSSDKGMRYLFAETQPYQGKRGSGKPKNWAGLRAWLLDGDIGPAATIEVWSDREADDGAAAAPPGDVLCFADKDLRMVQRDHLDWASHLRVNVQPGAWEVIDPETGKVYGRKWFYLQLLMGDNVDNIPGLGFWTRKDGKQLNMGPRTAEKALAGLDEQAAYSLCRSLYRASHGPVCGLERMAEQAVLLWMRAGDEGAAHEWLGATPAYADVEMFGAYMRLQSRAYIRRDELQEILDAANQNN